VRFTGSPHLNGGYLTTKSPIPTETIECPLCLGDGTLKRTEILDRLGVRDFARVAQLSAEEAIRERSSPLWNSDRPAERNGPVYAEVLSALVMVRESLGDREKRHRATSVHLLLVPGEGHVDVANMELFVEV